MISDDLKALADQYGVKYDRIEKVKALSDETGIPIDRLSITDWTPDHCLCQIRSWCDKANNNINRHYETLAACAAHAALSCTDYKLKDGQHLDIVLAESRAKSIALNTLAKAVPRVALIDGPCGVDPAKVAWSFDADRQLVVSVTDGLTIDEQATYSAALRSVASG